MGRRRAPDERGPCEGRCALLLPAQETGPAAFVTVWDHRPCTAQQPLSAITVPGRRPDVDATRGQHATADERRTDPAACAPGTWRPTRGLAPPVRCGAGKATAAGPRPARHGRAGRHRRNNLGTNTLNPVDRAAAFPAPAQTLDTGAGRGQWHRGRRSSRARISQLDLSRCWSGQTCHGRGVEARSTRHEETVQRAARRAVYAASAFRYVVMSIIMPALVVRGPPGRRIPPRPRRHTSAAVARPRGERIRREPARGSSQMRPAYADRLVGDHVSYGSAGP